MEDKRIKEQESLEIITLMIARTKERYMLGDGNIMLMWGYLTVAISILIWVLSVLTRHPAVNWLWFLIWIIGGTVTPVMQRRKSVKKGSKSYSDRIISGIWSSVVYSVIAITFLCLGFLLCRGIDAWVTMLVFALMIVPFAEIIQGLVLKEKFFIWGGATGLLIGIFTVCCIVGHVDLCVSWFMPVFIIAFICMMIIPGHAVNIKAKKSYERT